MIERRKLIYRFSFGYKILLNGKKVKGKEIVLGSKETCTKICTSISSIKYILNTNKGYSEVKKFFFSLTVSDLYTDVTCDLSSS